MKIVFLDADTMGAMDLKSAFAILGEYIQYGNSTTIEAIERSIDATVVITNKVKLEKDFFDKVKSVKLICIAATGMNNVDLEAAREYGVEVRNVKGYSTSSVAQHTFSMIFSLLNHTTGYDAYVKSLNGYAESPIFTNFQHEVWELKGKTLGVVGMGEIGKRVAGIAQIFGADVVYYSTSGLNDQAGFRRVFLEDLLTISDVVSIHAPLNKNTKGLIGIEQLSMMKKNAILVNTGRGGIVNEKDLAQALNKKMISGAALDVFESEPISKNNPLLTLKDPSRILFSPHIAWASKEARKNLLNGIVENIRQYFE